MESQITTRMLRKVKNNLPKGSMELIAERLKISPSTVSRVFTNKNKKLQPQVLELAISLIEEQKKKFETITTKINSI